MAQAQSSHQRQMKARKRSRRFGLNSFYNSTFAITWDIGVVMILIALAGLFDPNFLGMNLSYMHSFVLASTGLLAVWSGITNRRRSNIINLILGIFFILNAVIGLLIGDRGQLRFGYGSSEDLIVRFAPGFLELSYVDHIVHFVLGVFFLIVAFSWKRKSLDFPGHLNPRNHPHSDSNQKAKP